VDDLQVIDVLKKVAIGPVAQGNEDEGGFECLFCDGKSSPNFTEIDDVQHETRCPIIQARIALHYKGMRPSVFKVTGEYVNFIDYLGEHWTPFQAYTIGFDNEPWFLGGGCSATQCASNLCTRIEARRGRDTTGGQQVTFQETREEEPQALLYFTGDAKISMEMGAWLSELGAAIKDIRKVEITNEFDYQDSDGELVIVSTGKVTVVLRFTDGSYKRKTFKREER
jgi:hypothetical protein